MAQLQELEQELLEERQEELLEEEQEELLEEQQQQQESVYAAVACVLVLHRK